MDRHILILNIYYLFLLLIGGFMEILQSKNGDVSTMFLNGRFDAAMSGLVEDKLNAVINSHTCKVVIEISNVDYISSAGLRVLLAALKKVRKDEIGDIRLAGIQPQVRQVFDIAGFTQLFQIYESEEKAVESFQ